MPWYSIAVDTSVISLGTTGTLLFKSGTAPDGATKIKFRADDTGGGITGNHIDIYVGEGQAAIDEWYQTGGNRYVEVNKIHVEQHIKLEGDHVVFTVKVRNNGNSDHDVSIRYLWDTQLCDNDGSPLKAEGTIYTKEMCFDPVGFNHWNAYSRPDESQAELVTYSWWQDTPDKIIFAHWPEAIGSVYSYSWDPNRVFYTPGHVTSPESDSCVLTYWEDVRVPANGEKSVTVFYGTSVQTGLTLSMRLDRTEYTPDEIMKICAEVTDADGNSNFPLTKDTTEVKIDGKDVRLDELRVCEMEIILHDFDSINAFYH